MHMMMHKKYVQQTTGMPLSFLKAMGVVIENGDFSVAVDFDRLEECKPAFEAIRNDPTGLTASMYDVDYNDLVPPSNIIEVTSDEFNAAVRKANNALPKLAKGTQIYGYKVAIDKPKAKTKTKAPKYPVQQKSKRSIYKDMK